MSKILLRKGDRNLREAGMIIGIIFMMIVCCIGAVIGSIIGCLVGAFGLPLMMLDGHANNPVEAISNLLNKGPTDQI